MCVLVCMFGETNHEAAWNGMANNKLLFVRRQDFEMLLDRGGVRVMCV